MPRGDVRSSASGRLSELDDLACVVVIKRPMTHFAPLADYSAPIKEPKARVAATRCHSIAQGAALGWQ